MPTFEWEVVFGREFARLDRGNQAAFLAAVAQFVEDLAAGSSPRPGLRVKGVKGSSGVFEMSWAEDGRATFACGEERAQGQPHIIWRRVGTHAIFRRP